MGALDGADAEWLAGLPPTLTFDTPVGPAMVAHGFVADDFCFDINNHPQSPQWQALRAGKVALHLAGHTHRPVVGFLADVGAEDDAEWRGCTFVNAGTLHRGHDPCACVVDLGRGTVEWHPLRGDVFGPPRVAALPLG